MALAIESRRLYHARLKQGKCPRCGGKPKRGYKHCRKCTMLRSEQGRSPVRRKWNRAYQQTAERKAWCRAYNRKRNKKRLRDPKYREYLRNLWHRYYARCTGNGGAGWTAAEWLELKRRYGFRCACCGKRKPLERDHIIAVKRAGRCEISNIQPLCRSCNASKGSRVRYTCACGRMIRNARVRLRVHPNCQQRL